MSMALVHRGWTCLDMFGDNGMGGGFVCLHGRFWLWMAHFLKHALGWHSLACIGEHGTNFSLHRGRHNGFDDLRDSQDLSIVGGEFDVSGYKKMAASVALRLGLAEVGSVVVNSKD